MNSIKPACQLNRRLKADLALLLTALLWGSALVAQRVAAQHSSVYLFNGVRFLIGALVLTPLLAKNKPTRRKIQWADLPGLGLAGFLLFAGITLQQYGMRFTTAANAGFITGLYIVIIPIFLALVMRKPPRLIIWLAAALAILGLYLLSTAGSYTLAPGDGFELAGAAMWAFHVLLIGWLVQRMDVIPLAIVQYLVCAFLSFVVGWLLEPHTLGNLSGVWWAVFYTGVFSIGLGYTFQVVGQKVAPAADAAIILSCEAVFAAVFGWLLLNERLSAIQLSGCGLMFIGMILAQAFPVNWIENANQSEGDPAL